MNEANRRRKLWYHNWRHAVAAAKWVNAQLEAAKGKTAFTFNDAADAWIEHCEQRVRAKQPDMTERTVYNYRLHLKQIQQRFGRVLLHEIKTRDIKDWLLKEAERLKHTSLVARLVIIQHVLRYAHERDMLAINPLVVQPVKLPGKKTKRADRPDPSDMEKLREHLDGPRPFCRSRNTWSGIRVAAAWAAAADCGRKRFAGSGGMTSIPTQASWTSRTRSWAVGVQGSDWGHPRPKPVAGRFRPRFGFGISSTSMPSSIRSCLASASAT